MTARTARLLAAAFISERNLVGISAVRFVVYSIALRIHDAL